MFSLQKLVSKDEALFDLLESSAGEACESMEALNRILSDPGRVPSLTEFHQSKEADKRITERITEALIHSFVVELDREDIEAVSATLYKIPKTVEKFAERFIVCAEAVRGVDFSRYIQLLDQATLLVREMVKVLRDKPPVGTIKEMNSRMQSIEGEADQLILDVLKDLFSGRHDPIRVMALKDLFELLEKVIDRCRDAGNAIAHVVLKHS